MTQIYPEGESVTVCWETCAAVTAFRDDVRGIWGESGWVIYVLPQLLKRGEAVELVDALVPPEIVVDMGDDPSPALSFFA